MNVSDEIRHRARGTLGAGSGNRRSAARHLATEEVPCFFLTLVGVAIGRIVARTRPGASRRANRIPRRPPEFILARVLSRIRARASHLDARASLRALGRGPSAAKNFFRCRDGIPARRLRAPATGSRRATARATRVDRAKTHPCLPRALSHPRRRPARLANLALPSVSRGRAASGHNTQPSSSARCVGPTSESRKGTARVASSPTESSGRDDGQTRGRGRGRGEAPRAASRQRRGRPGGGGRGGDGRPARRGQRSRRRGTRGPASQRRRPRGRRPAARPRARQEPGEEHALPRALPQGVPGQVREPHLRFPPPPAHNPRQGTPHPRPFGSLVSHRSWHPPSFIFARLTPPPPPSFHPATPGPNPRKTPPPSPRIPTTWMSPRRC